MPTAQKKPPMTPQARDALIEMLEGTNRKLRQESARALAMMAREDVTLLLDKVDVFVEALSLPEAQTRWECLDVLSEVARERPDAVLDAFAGAEESLFDDGSASARLAAFRFLTRYGSIKPECATKAWPLISEAVQCYHGDPEYREMLICLKDFAGGNLGDDVRKQLGERMKFDATTGRGFIRAYSTEICSIVSGEE